jgi:hypothetical protein
VKTCLKITTGQDRLNAVSALSIERDYISIIADFNKVTQKFAEQKNRKAAFLFK